jgi:hypothetical protein
VTNGCPDFEELERWASAPADDPRRLHTQLCPRCGAWLASMDLFRDPPAHAPGSDAADADARLARFLEREIVGAPAAKPVRPRARGSRFFGRHQLAAAVVVVAMVGIYAGRGLLIPAPRVILRDAPAATATVRLDTVVRQPDGTLRLAWSPASGADAYAVLLLDADGREMARLDGTAACERVILAAMADSLATSSPLFVQILARRSGDELARSRPRLVP